jgi:hypothetical protein
MSVMKLAMALSCVALVACGSDNKKTNNPDGNTGGDGNTGIDGSNRMADASVDAPPAPAMLTISGTVTARGLGGSTPVAGATVGAYSNANETTPVKTATTTAQGKFTLTFATGGVALDGFLKASKTGYADTYVYAEAPIAMNETGVPVNMLTTGNFQTLSVIAQGNQMAGMGLIAMEVLNAPPPTGMTVGGATIATNPAASVYRYNGNNGFPSAMATVTAADGIGYAFNVMPGVSVTVSATKTGSTFQSHVIKAWADSLTTTSVSP